MKRNFIIVAVLFLLIAISIAVFYDTSKTLPTESNEVLVANENKIEGAVQEKESMESEENAEKINESRNIEKEEVKTIESDEAKSVLLKVPFVSQAPLGKWDDPLFQNGCEEAAVIMAMAWVEGETVIDAQEGTKKIKDIGKFEEKVFGHNVDTDVADVLKLIEKYYGYEKIEAKYDFNENDIVKQLQSGNIMLIPTFGRVLKNPNYTLPGPITHMLVVTGFDDEKKEFITNDPGTRKGEEYRYSYKILMDAIWSYPSGKTHPQPPKKENFKKVMIVVKKNK